MRVHSIIKCCIANMYAYMFVDYHVTLVHAVGCPQGTYQTLGGGERVFNGEGIKENYPICQLCPVGSYQDQLASVDCQICPEYYQTRGPGSTAREDCYGKYL